MKMKKVIIFLLVLILSGCLMQKYKKIHNFVAKNYFKSDFIDKVEKQLTHPKSTKTQKIIFIRELAEYQQKNINDYLKETLFPRFANEKEIQKEVLLALIKLRYPENIFFFMNLIISKTEYLPLAKNAIIELDKEHFSLWKEFLYFEDRDFRSQIVQIINQMKNKPIDLIIIEFIAQEDQIKKSLLDYYFAAFKEKTAKEITNFILNGQIKEFNEIEKVIEIIGNENLVHLMPLFKSDIPDVESLNTEIFTSFEDDCIFSIKEIYPEIQELKNQKKVFNICESIGTNLSFETLEIWLEQSESIFEKKEIIKSMTNISDAFPDIFIKYAADPDNSYDVIKSLDKYIYSNPESVLNAFYSAQDIAKIKFLEFLIERNEIELLVDIFSRLHELDLDVRIYTLLKIMNYSYKSYCFDFIVSMLNSSINEEFSFAVQYCYLNKENFSNFIIEEFDSLAYESNRIRELAQVLKNTRSEEELGFIFNKYLDYFPLDKSLGRAFGNLYINNKYLNSSIIGKQFSNNSEKSMIQAYVYLLSLINNVKTASLDAFSRLSQEFFFRCNTEDRIRIINFTYKYKKESILQFLLKNYDKMNLTEKKLLNSSLNNFNIEIFKSHLERIVYIGDEEDFFLFENLLKFRFNESMPDDILEMLVYFYFKNNNFQKSKDYLSQMSNQTDFTKDMLNTINLCEKSMEFSQKYIKYSGVNPINPAYIYKSVQDSLLLARFVVRIENIANYDSLDYQFKIQSYTEQLNKIQKIYDSYFKNIINDDEFIIEHDLLIKVLNSKFVNKLNCGNIVYEPESGNLYLEIILEIKNPTENNIEFNLSDYVLKDKEKNSYKIKWESYKYYTFIEKKFSFVTRIDSLKTEVIQFLFEVPADVSEFVLSFQNESLNPINTPIIIRPKY